MLIYIVFLFIILFLFRIDYEKFSNYYIDSINEKDLAELLIKI